YLSQRVAQIIDEELMSQAGGFSIDQLMELAGLSVAQAISKVYSKESYSRILICCGPGNNGGDGLVAARHLSHFGYRPNIFYPKQSKKDLYQRLVVQCNNLKIPFVNELNKQILNNADLVLDAIFGFGFSGEIRSPFGVVIQLLKEISVPIASVDIPSAWDVEKGNIDDRSFTPAMLISLTAPKLGTRQFRGIHYLGGRFVTP
ncbi:4441_t:CDS:2, partial [Ambispora leptoticha]